MPKSIHQESLPRAMQSQDHSGSTPLKISLFQYQVDSETLDLQNRREREKQKY